MIAGLTTVKDIVAGPTLEQLLSALRNRSQQYTVYFTIKVNDIQKREFFIVEGISHNYNYTLPWKINLVSLVSDERFVAFYDPTTNAGNITHDGDMPIVLLSLTLETRRLLLDSGVVTLNDLLAKSEIEVVMIFASDELRVAGMMSNEIASRAVCRFEVLRDRLDKMGVRFCGTRRTMKELWESF